MTPPNAPITAEMLVRNAGIPDAAAGAPGGGVRLCDIAIADGRIVAVGEASSMTPDERTLVLDLDRGLVLPGFVDLHTHLDKGHIWPRQANPDGTFMGALGAVMADRAANWSATDIERRMEFALRSAHAHGTVAIRTHLDSAPPQLDIAWDIFERMRDRWAGRIELQGVSLVGPDQLLDRGTADLIAGRVTAAGGVMGGSIAVHPRSREAMFAAVETAGRHGLDLDLHIDETLDPAASGLLHLAEAVLETGYDRQVVAGHCCALSTQDEALAARTIELVARAGIAIVSLPMCNLYLQDRAGAGGRTPRYRGVTLVNELRADGVKVALASDNTRDPFYAYGDLDCLEVLREGARIAHFDHPMDAAFGWTSAIGATPAEIAGFEHRAIIAPGAPADLVLFRARTWTELMSRPQVDRVVLRRGEPVDRTLPDYRELDDLFAPAAR